MNWSYTFDNKLIRVESKFSCKFFFLSHRKINFGYNRLLVVKQNGEMIPIQILSQIQIYIFS